MIKYAKIINDDGLCEVGMGTNINFYKSIGMSEMDVQRSDIDGRWYLTNKCLMKTDAEKQKEAAQLRIAEIKAELEELDRKTIRPLRAGETEKLKELEQEARGLRDELKELESV